MAIETSVQRGGIVGSAPRANTSLPALPRTVEDTGLDFLFLVELVAKVLFVRGQISLAELSAHLRLPATVLETLLAFMRTERLCEVARRGGNDGDVNYQLTDAGRQRADRAISRAASTPASRRSACAPMPTPSRRNRSPACASRAKTCERAFAGVVVKPVVLDQVGAAMNSGRAMFLYGPAGSGKTYLAERLRGLLQGSIVVPHAIAVGNEVIQIFDPLVHRPIEAKADPAGALDRAATGDARWVLCERPGRAVRRRAEARDARPRLRRGDPVLPGAAAPQGEQRHLRRRRPRPAARDAARPDEPLGRAARPPQGLPVAAHRPQVRGALRRGGGLLHQPAADGPRRRGVPAPAGLQDLPRPDVRGRVPRDLPATSARSSASRTPRTCSGTCCATTTTARTSRGSRAIRATSSPSCAISPSTKAGRRS